MAQSAEVKGKECTVSLKSRYFSDGTALTAEDVVYSFNLAKKSNTEYAYKLYEALSKVTLGELKIPYVTNVDASIIKDTERTKELLKEQVYSSVLWEQSIRAMIADGVDIFVEIGPGKTLSGFMRKIDKSVKMFRIGTMEEVEKTVEAIKEL